MGSYNTISDFAVKCPDCGAVVNDFQSKDGACDGRSVPFTTVNHFYSFCDGCSAWIEARYEGDSPFRTIDHYRLTITKKGETKSRDLRLAPVVREVVIV